MSQAGKFIDESLRHGQGMVLENVVLAAANVPYQIGVNQRMLSFTTDLADASGIVVLPSKAEAVGKWYYIEAPTGATAGDISVYDKESNSELTTIGDLDADADKAIYFCTGTAWVAWYNGVA